jgi:hypothetical protein
MNTAVIYPGRFQPMLSHHAQVYSQLQASFPGADVYIGTSDKVDGDKSPFDFEEKRKIMQAHGIPADKVLMVRSPYNASSYDFDVDNTILIFVVGEKDMDRFPFNNVDPETGLDMTARGEPKPKYLQKIETMDQGALPMSQRGYIALAPTIKTGNEIASASAFRQSLKTAPDVEAAKELYVKQFGQFDDAVFNLIYNKLMGNKMNEQMITLRKLAGLPVQEGAPVNMSPGYTMTDTERTLAHLGRLIMDMANQRPMGKGTPDSELEFQNMLSDFGSRLTDGRIESQSQLIQFIKGAGDKAPELLDVTKQAMADLSSGKRAAVKGEEVPDEDDAEEEVMDSVDLSDIRDEYGIEESSPQMEGKYQDYGAGTQLIVNQQGFAPVIAKVTHFHDMTGSFYAEIHELDDSGKPMAHQPGDDVEQVLIKQNGQVETATTDNFDGQVDANVALANGVTSIQILQKLYSRIDKNDIEESQTNESEACEQCGSEDCTCPPGECTCEPVDEARGGDVDEDAQRELELYAENDEALYTQSYVPIAKNLSKKFKKGTYDSELAKKLWMYHADRAAKKYGEDHAGGEKEGLAMFNPNTRRALAADLEDSWHDEMQVGNFMESDIKETDDKFENAMAAYDAHGEEGLAKALGMSIEEFDQELNEYCASHGLHADDDREEAIQGMIDDAEQMSEQMSDLRKLSGLEEAEGDDCEKCRGTGMLDKHSEDPHKCDACDGKGKEKWKPAPVDFDKFKVGEAEAVEETADNAMAAAMAELRKLAGI